MGRGRVAPSWVAMVVALVAAGAARAQDPVSGLSGYFTLGSGYWKHGLSQSDGPSLQLGIDYQHYTGFFAYARAMNVDYPQESPVPTARRRNERVRRLSRSRRSLVLDGEPRPLLLSRQRQLRLRRVERERRLSRPRLLYGLIQRRVLRARGLGAEPGSLGRVSAAGEFRDRRRRRLFRHRRRSQDHALERRRVEARGTSGDRFALLRRQLRLAQLSRRSERREFRPQRLVRR